MKAAIVYDSVSRTRMTEKVALIVRDGLKEKGVEAEAFRVNDASNLKVEDYDCLLIGSPTMGWRPTPDTMKFLEGLKGKPLSGKPAASFDTQLKSFISGNANKAIDSKLKELGFKMAVAPLQAYVKGGRDNYQMREGEEDKAKEWAKGLAEQIQ